MLDLGRVESLISNCSYDESYKELSEIIENTPNRANKELIYKSLSLLNLISDKTPLLSEKIVKLIDSFITDSDSWIRLVSLEILFQISMYRPNLLIDLIEKIRSRLFDQDPPVRRLAVKLIGNLVLSLHIDVEELQELIQEFTERLMDNDWKVKLHVIKTLQKILNQDYTKIKDLEPLLSIVIVNLRDKDEDVARSAAELLKTLGMYFLSKEKTFYVLLNLLYNEEPRVQELIVWLFGEIGREKSSEIIPIIPKLIKLLEGDDYRIQAKIIDALVNIAENNFDQIWSNLINSVDTSNFDYRNNLVNAIYQVAQKNVPEIISYTFDELENPSKNVRESVAVVFKRLYEEYQIEIENEIAKILYSLESAYWRERNKTVNLLQNICFILNNKKIAVWITIELTEAFEREKDGDLKKQLTSALNQIKSNFKDIDTTIKKIKDELELLNDKIEDFQKIPAEFREKMNSNLEDFRFNYTEIQLNNIYDGILKKIKNLDKRLNKFEYKRLAFDLIEEWEETKVQILDEIAIIKGFISELYEEKKEEFVADLKRKTQLFEDRINILKAQFDTIKEYKFNDNLDATLSSFIIQKDVNLDEKFQNITQIRKNLFKIDVDIREQLINNLEFDEIYKELLKKWVAAKIEIQEYLSDLDRQIKITKERIVSQYLDQKYPTKVEDTAKISGLNDALAFQLFQSHLESIISQGIEGFKKFNNNFDNYNSKLELLIKKNDFSQANQLIQMNTTQIQNFIEEIDKQIDNIVGNENIFEDNNKFNLYVRPYVNKWNASKELLITKLKGFTKKNYDKLYLSQIRHYLRLMNPIKLDLLSSYMKLDLDRLKELILKFINKNDLDANIINDVIYSQEIESDLSESKSILFFKSIKTIGNKIYLYFKLNNPSNFDFKDLQIYLKVPKNLKFMKKESFPKFLHVNELKQGNIFQFSYVLKLNKEVPISGDNPLSYEIKLMIYYKDPFNLTRKTIKKLDVLLA